MTQSWKHFGEGGKIVHKLVDDIQHGATARADQEAMKGAAFANPGAFTARKTEPIKFAGAAELGSKEAYSTIAQSRTQSTAGSEQRRIAGATERAAGAGERSVALLQQIAGSHQRAKPLKPHLPAAS